MPCTYESNPHVARKAGADLRENNTFSFNGAWARASQTSNNGSTSSIVRPFLAGSSGECRNTKLHTLMKVGERKDVRNVAKKGTKPQKTSVWWFLCGRTWWPVDLVHRFRWNFYTYVYFQVYPVRVFVSFPTTSSLPSPVYEAFQARQQRNRFDEF